jgi:hypothetical protein
MQKADARGWYAGALLAGVVPDLGHRFTLLYPQFAVFHIAACRIRD